MIQTINNKGGNVSLIRRFVFSIRRVLTGTKPLYYKSSRQVYYQSDELGTIGRREGTDVETRLRGMEYLLQSEHLKGATLLDAGCAEGMISKAYTQAGVELVHGFDLQDISVKYANELFLNSQAQYVFRQADMSRWEDFINNNSDILKAEYDVVLFLSVYHHIVRENGRRTADKALLKLAQRASKYFVLRTTITFPEDRLLGMGYEKVFEQNDPLETDPLRVYARN